MISRVIINMIKNAVDGVPRKEQAADSGRGEVPPSRLETFWYGHENGGHPCIHISTISKSRLILSTEAAYRDHPEGYGISEKVINIVMVMYEGCACAVVDDGELTGWFRITSGGVKQGCVMTSGFCFVL